MSTLDTVEHKYLIYQTEPYCRGYGIIFPQQCIHRTSQPAVSIEVVTWIPWAPLTKSLIYQRCFDQRRVISEPGSYLQLATVASTHSHVPQWGFISRGDHLSSAATNIDLVGKLSTILQQF